MPANVDAMIRAAVEAIRAGKKQDARTLLEKAVDLDEYNENAWLWLSATVETPEEQRTCLDNVLIINPNNEKAKAGLKALGFSPNTPTNAPTGAGSSPFTDAPLPATPAFTMDDDLFGDVDFSAPGGRSATPPPPANDIIATSSASASFQGADVDYDAWMDGLNIGSSGKSAPTTAPTAFDNAASTFDASGIQFGEDDEFFSPPPPAPARPAATSRPAPPEAASPFGDEPFNDNPFGDDPFGTPAMSVDEDIFGEADEAFSNIGDSNFDNDSLLSNVGGQNPYEMSADELFARIPNTIQAGRLPGVDEKYPATAFVLIILGILLNVGGLGLILSKLAA